MSQGFNKMEREIAIKIGEAELQAIMAIPDKAKTIIVFVHGSGSSRFSTRNNFVARVLQDHNHATLLMDLLTEKESQDRKNVFDISLLAERLLLVKLWLNQNSKTRRLKLGYFGASTGAAAALMAAAREPKDVFAVVSRGGRPDLAEGFLKQVLAPCLLLVGGNDDIVIDLNRKAFASLFCPKDFKIISGATHLFEEPGTLEQVAESALNWFDQYSKAELLCLPLESN
jgi:putative phosphoribosyl transferase